MTINLTDLERVALAQLREAAESRPDAGGFQQVYLDNCPMSSERRTWAAVLGSLAKKGLYKPQGDDCFGDVKAE